jgi:hypothetical protein
MTGVGGVNSTGSISININDIGSGSVQLLFAKLQLTLAELSKNSASDYMNQIQSSQDEQKKVSQMTQAVRQSLADFEASGEADFPPEIIAYMEENGLALPASIVKNELIEKTEEVLVRCKAAREGSCAHPWITSMTAEDARFFTDNGVAYDRSGNDLNHDTGQWDLTIRNLEAFQATLPDPLTAADLKTAVTSLQSHLDTLGVDTQQKMVFVQDFMGQFNSYLQGANSVIQQSNQTLGELARSR